MISSYRPFFDWSEILAALRPGMGRSEFETAVANQVGARYGLAFAYGRSALIAFFKSLGINQAEVIMPAYTCAVVAEAVVVSGNKPVFVDIDLANYNMDIGAIRKALTSRTRAIIVTHMFGYPTDVEAIRQEVNDDRILIIEDAALALLPATPGTTNLRGDIALYSFGRGKQLYTITGGVIVTNSSDLYEKMKLYRDREMSQLPRSVGVRRRMQILTAYMALNRILEERLVQLKNIRAVKRTREVIGLARVDMPHDYATSYIDFQGRIGLTQLHKLETCLQWSRTFAEFYHSQLQGLPGLTPAPMLPDAAYTYYTVRVGRRDEIGFIRQMRHEGIEVGRNFNYMLPQLKSYQQFADNDQYSRAKQAAEEVVNLPNYAGLKWIEAEWVVACVRRFCNNSMLDFA